MSKKPHPAPEAGAEDVKAEAAAETPAASDAQTALAEAAAALAEAKDQYIRLLAEYDNYRKRTLKEKEGIYTDAKSGAVSALLPVYDNLARALAAETCDEAYRKGVEMTFNQCVAAFEKLGATRIAALGEPFDPNFHNAVMHVEDETAAENTVVEVFQDGFLLGERVIRFAMVKVAN